MKPENENITAENIITVEEENQNENPQKKIQESRSETSLNGKLMKEKLFIKVEKLTLVVEEKWFPQKK